MYKNFRISICSLALTVFFLLISLTLPLSVFAEDSNFSIRLWGQVSPIISGDAGNNSGAPNYDDAFKTGVGGGVELSWRFCRWFSCVGGAGYEVYDGDNYQGLSFSDLEIVPVYIGGKFHLIPDNASWDFYLRMDLGAAHFSSVDISFMSLKSEYWDSSWEFFYDVGVGTEYRRGAWGLSLDIKARYLGSPDAALGKPSKADASWSIPVSLGINYHF